MHEVVPLVRQKNQRPAPGRAGLQLRRLSRGQHRAAPSGCFYRDACRCPARSICRNFLDGYYDQDCYFNLPTHYLPNLGDPWFFDRYRRNTYVLATGWDDQCLGQNQNLDRIMSDKGIPHKLYVWDSYNAHDWPTWQRMVQEYL